MALAAMPKTLGDLPSEEQATKIIPRPDSPPQADNPRPLAASPLVNLKNRQRQSAVLRREDSQ
jgi:hypothetical protein